MRNFSGYLICYNVLLDRNGVWFFFKKLDFLGIFFKIKL